MAKIEFKKPGDNNKCFLGIHDSKIGNNSVIVTRDEAQAVLYNTLIAEERAKSDHLRSSILPPNLVKRVQAAIHAKETVEFGLEAIQAIEENNKEMNLSLRIRVGVNTGGPIVAGVLGTEKPTFEILGPAINMAQQMEHHGVPMKVHISRSTYELIYGGSFVIKERSQIEIKKGTVLTYLVESKK